MAVFLRFATNFLDFLRDTLVPFFTEVPKGLPYLYLEYSLVEGEFVWRVGQMPWLFGDVTFGEFLLVTGLTGMLVFRLIKFFTDIIL